MHIDLRILTIFVFSSLVSLYSFGQENSNSNDSTQKKNEQGKALPKKTIPAEKQKENASVKKRHAEKPSEGDNKKDALGVAKLKNNSIKKNEAPQETTRRETVNPNESILKIQQLDKDVRSLSSFGKILRNDSMSLSSSNRKLTTITESLSSANRNLTILLGLLFTCFILLFTIAGYVYKNYAKIFAKLNTQQVAIDTYNGQLQELTNKNVGPKAPGPSDNSMLLESLKGLVEDITLLSKNIKSQIYSNPRDTNKPEIKTLDLQGTFVDHQNANRPPNAAQISTRNISLDKDAFENSELYIKAEILVSAGPRKDTGGNDTELGEDVSGILSLPDQTFFWLLDGTSDSAAIKGPGINYADMVQTGSHIFSSRLLAQNLGNYIQKNIMQGFKENISMDKLLINAKTQVLEDWERRINNESTEKKNAILSLISQGFKPLCSSTVIIGRLLTNGHLCVLRSGDSKVYPFKTFDGNNLTLDNKFEFITDPSEDNDRVAFQLGYNKDSDRFGITSNSPRYLIDEADNVMSIFAFSDGIGRTIEAQLASNNPGIVEMIKENISRIQQKTFDDKTLIILTRVVNP